MSNVSMSIVSMLYNMQLMKYAGADGVAAYGVLMYVSMIFQAIFIGFAVGTAPIVGFNFGAQNTAELKGLLSKSLRIIGVLRRIHVRCRRAFASAAWQIVRRV